MEVITKENQVKMKVLTEENEYKMKVFTEENQDEFVCADIEGSYPVCHPRDIFYGCTFEYFIQYITAKYLKNYKGDLTKVIVYFYISKIRNKIHIINPILLKISVNYKIPRGYVYKIQDDKEEDITNEETINVVDKEGNETQQNVNFFNAILVEDVKDVAASEATQLEDVKINVGGKLKAKGQKKKPSKKPVVSQSKENKYKEVLGKRMKIYKKPDSRKEFVRYKGELVALVEYKKSKKEMAKSKNAKK